MTPKRGIRGESTHLVGDLSAYMTGGEAEDRSQKCRRVHFYTLGLERLEFAKKSHKKSKRLTELFQTFSQRGKSYDFTLDSEEHERALLGSLRENFPFVANLDESQILFVDCRATGDPASDKSLRDHLGTYPPNMKHTTTNPKWVDWWKEAEEAVKLARQIWKEVVLETGDRLPEPGGSAAADKEEKAAREAEPERGSMTSQVTFPGAQRGQGVTLPRAPARAWASTRRRTRTLSAGIFAAA